MYTLADEILNRHPLAAQALTAAGHAPARKPIVRSESDYIRPGMTHAAVARWAHDTSRALQAELAEAECKARRAMARARRERNGK